MNYMKLTLLSLFSMIYGTQAQSIYFKGKEFEISNVKAYGHDSDLGCIISCIKHSIENYCNKCYNKIFQLLRSELYEKNYDLIRIKKCN